MDQMEMQMMLKMMSDETVDALVQAAREERKLRHARRDFEYRINDLIADAKGMGIGIVSKETGEILEDVPFYFM